MADLRHGRIPSLDGVRAIAIFMVLLAHGRASHGFPSLGHLVWITEHGLLGVEVFFALSGFLITVLMLREFDRSGSLNLGGFYLRRIMRIFPAYIALLLVVKWLERRGLAFPVPGDWTAALTYTMNFRRTLWSWELAHLWSLSIEEQFYLVWPLLMLITPPRFRVALPVTGLAIALLSRCLLISVFRSYSYGIRGWTCCRIDSIAAGCLLAILAWQPRSRLVLDRLARIPSVGLVPLLGLIGSVYLPRLRLSSHSLYVTRLSSFWEITLSYSVNAICITGLIWWLANREKSLIARVLNFPLVAGIGTLSYSLYIWQELFLNRDHVYWWTTYPQNIACTFIAAGLSYCLIELPFLKLKDRLGAKRHGSVNARAASAL